MSLSKEAEQRTRAAFLARQADQEGEESVRPLRARKPVHHPPSTSPRLAKSPRHSPEHTSVALPNVGPSEPSSVWVPSPEQEASSLYPADDFDAPYDDVVDHPPTPVAQPLEESVAGPEVEMSSSPAAAEVSAPHRSSSELAASPAPEADLAVPRPDPGSTSPAAASPASQQEAVVPESVPGSGPPPPASPVPRSDPGSAPAPAEEPDLAQKYLNLPSSESSTAQSSQEVQEALRMDKGKGKARETETGPGGVVSSGSGTPVGGDGVSYASLPSYTHPLPTSEPSPSLPSDILPYDAPPPMSETQAREFMVTVLNRMKVDGDTSPLVSDLPERTWFRPVEGEEAQRSLYMAAPQSASRKSASRLQLDMGPLPLTQARLWNIVDYVRAWKQMSPRARGPYPRFILLGAHKGVNRLWDVEPFNWEATEGEKFVFFLREGDTMVPPLDTLYDAASKSLVARAPTSTGAVTGSVPRSLPGGSVPRSDPQSRPAHHSSSPSASASAVVPGPVPQSVTPPPAPSGSTSSSAALSVENTGAASFFLGTSSSPIASGPDFSICRPVKDEDEEWVLQNGPGVESIWFEFSEGVSTEAEWNAAVRRLQWWKQLRREEKLTKARQVLRRYHDGVARYWDVAPFGYRLIPTDKEPTPSPPAAPSNPSSSDPVSRPASPPGRIGSYSGTLKPSPLLYSSSALEPPASPVRVWVPPPADEDLGRDYNNLRKVPDNRIERELQGGRGIIEYEFDPANKRDFEIAKRHFYWWHYVLYRAESIKVPKPILWKMVKGKREMLVIPDGEPYRNEK